MTDRQAVSSPKLPQRNTTKRQVTLHFDPEVVMALEIDAKRRGLTLARTANDIVRKALIDEATEKLADTVKARLDRLDRRDQSRGRELALIKQMLLVYVRVWFEYAGAPPEADEDDSADAALRFQNFLELAAAEAAG